MSVPIPKRSHSHVVGIDVGKHSDEGRGRPPIDYLRLIALGPANPSLTHYAVTHHTLLLPKRTHFPSSLFSPCCYPCPSFFTLTFHPLSHVAIHNKTNTYMDIRDLLVRHEKLVHLNEGSKDSNRPRKLSSNTSTASHKSSISEGQINVESLGLHHHNGARPQQSQQSQQSLPPPPPQHFRHGPVASSIQRPAPQDPRAPPRPGACNLDLLSDAALASSSHTVQATTNGGPPHPSEETRRKSYGDSIVAYADRPRDEPQSIAPTYAAPPSNGSYDDYNPFLDEFASSSHFLPPNFEPDQQMSMWSRQPGGAAQRRSSKSSFMFPGRFPPPADSRESGDGPGRGLDDSSRPSSLHISVVDHTIIKNRLDEFSSVLPNDFVFPSRHTLTRFLEGYISGLHEHLPFLHLPTFSPAETAPELLLAILAVGAQYRFEKNRGYALWYAAKAIAMEQIRRRRISEVHALLPTPAAYSPHSTRPSPSATYRHSFASAQSERPTTQDTHREP